jgi:salicylate hydroxylase
LKRLEIAIAGAGLAGLAAALALHRLGHKVIIFEQFDTPKPIGSGLILQPTGLSVLDWLGLGDEIRALGARIDRLFGAATGTGRTVLDVRYDAIGSARGCAVHRAALFNVLFNAVKHAGIEIETTRQISDSFGGYLKFVDRNVTTKFNLIIDALGARSPLRQKCFPAPNEKHLAYGALWASLPWPEHGFDPHALEQRYDQASVMIGVLPIGRVAQGSHAQTAFFWSIRHADIQQWKARGLNAWKDDVLRHWPQTEGLLSYIQHADDLTFARYQHHTVLRPYGDRMISIGDSCHSTSPQLGQGCNMALLDVRALCEAMQQHSNFDHVAKDYTHRRKRHVRVYQAMSAMFTPFYQSDSKLLPLFRDHVVPPLARIPLAQRMLAKLVAGTFVEPVRAGRQFMRDHSTNGEWNSPPSDDRTGGDVGG